MKKAQAILICILFFFSTSIFSQRVSERLNRGLVAVRVNAAQVFLSWRLLGSDPDNVAFNIYKNGSKINASPITTSTNYTDSEITTVNYTLKTVVNGVETGESQTITPWTSNYKDIVLSVPASMTMPDATTCTYSPGDCSTGDVDGDGEFEIVLKWDPSNAKDNSQSGYTGNVFIDVYKIDGTHLCRIDLGKNIRAGAHYTQFQVADYDGDGKAEIACKTAPGTKDGKGNYISKGPAALASHTTDYRNTSGYIL
jgi:rhamnogalacturonan endolyase